MLPTWSILAAALACGCVVSSPNLDKTQFRCDGAEASSCPDGQRCALGRCVGEDEDNYSVTCTAPAPALANIPSVSTREPTLHSGGLALIADDGSRNLFQSDRPSLDGVFGPLSPATLILRTGIEDVSFIDLDGAPKAIATAGGNPRFLVYCDDPQSADPCETLELFDETGAAITDDVDGPALAEDAAGLLMTFSRGDAIFVARPRGGLLIQWDAKRIAFGSPTDDPGITKDGALLVSKDGDSLYAMRWDDELGNYTDRVPVAGLEGFSSWELGELVDSTFEAFASGDTRGISEPHRVECTTTLPLP